MSPLDSRRPGWTGPFEVVTLPEPERRCMDCVVLSSYRDYAGHNDRHSPNLGRHLPPRWRVAAALPGDAIPVGTTLCVVAANHQNYLEGPGGESIRWLLEAEDGAQAGAIFSVLTSADYGPSFAGFDDQLANAAHPLWPEGLKVLR